MERLKIHKNLIRNVVMVLLCCSLLFPSWMGKAHAAEGPDLANLISQIEQAGDDAAKQMDTAIEIFKNYPDWKNNKSATVSEATAKLIDSKRFQMAQQAFGALANKSGGITHVVPIGSAAASDPFVAGSSFKVGVSDIDLIPYGPNSGQSADQFKSLFRKMYKGLDPDSIKINVLTSTNIKDWKSRVAALVDYEKYNSVGGNIAMQNYLWQTNGSVWNFDPVSGKLKIGSARAVMSQPTALTSADALGYWGDNTRFIAEHAKDSTDKRIAAIAKYNIRNVEAYKVAGGVLSPAEQSLMQAAELAKKGNVEDAVRNFLYLESGAKVTSKQMKQYLTAMDNLTQKMGSDLVTKHMELIAKELANGNPTSVLRSELAGFMANLPEKQLKGIYNAAIKGNVARDMMWQEGKTIAKALTKEKTAAKFAIDYFNTQAQQKFGKLYSELSTSEKMALHGAGEEMATFGSRALKVAGVGLFVGFTAWAAYEGYLAGKEKGGTALGTFAAFAQAAASYMQYKSASPTVAAEMMVRLVAWGVKLGASAYENKVLDTLYERYKNGERLDDILYTTGVTGYYAGGLRELAIKLREEAAKEGHPLSEAELDEEIKAYFVRRLEMENQAKALDHWMAKAESWISRNDIPLSPSGDSLTADSDNTYLQKKNPKEYNRLLGVLLEKFTMLENRLLQDKVAFNEKNIWYVLYLQYRGTPQDVDQALKDLYAGSGKEMDVAEEEQETPAGTPILPIRLKEKMDGKCLDEHGNTVYVSLSGEAETSAKNWSISVRENTAYDGMFDYPQRDLYLKVSGTATIHNLTIAFSNPANETVEAAHPDPAKSIEWMWNGYKTIRCRYLNSGTGQCEEVSDDGSSLTISQPMNAHGVEIIATAKTTYRVLSMGLLESETTRIYNYNVHFE